MYRIYNKLQYFIFLLVLKPRYLDRYLIVFFLNYYNMIFFCKYLLIKPKLNYM